MFNPDVLTFQEFIMQEQLPLAAIQRAVLEFLLDRDDVALFGAQAVNAYVPEPRMTQEVDILSPHAAKTASDLRDYLAERFHIAVRVRKVAQGRGYRVYQVRKPSNRHLVDVQQAEEMPDVRRISGVPVIAPAELVARKIISIHQRRGKPKSGTDWRDVAMLLLAFPELKAEEGPVRDRLQEAGVEEAIIALWHETVAQDIEPEDEEDPF